MQTGTLTKRLLSLVALLLAVVMAFSACNNDGTSSGDETANTDSVEGEQIGNENADDETESTNSDVESENEDENSSETNSKKTSSKKTSSVKTSSKKTSSVKTSSKKTSSKKTSSVKTSSKKTSSKKTSSKKTSSVKTSSSKKTGTYTWGSDPYANISSDVQEKGIHVLMWRKYLKTEQQVIDDFTAKTGIKVRTTVTTEAQYTTKLVSLLASDPPDVVMMEAADFPSVVVNALQPLDEEIFRLDDSCWKKKYMDNFKVNGNYYTVAIGGSFNVDDVNYVTYYNPTVLSSYGITTMPYELYQQGKWDWDAQEQIVLQVDKQGASKNVTGYACEGHEMFMLSAGQDFVTYDGKNTFKSNLDNFTNGSLVDKAFQRYSKLFQESAVSGYDLAGFQKGTVGLFTTISFYFQKATHNFDAVPGGAAQLQVVPVAGPTQSTAYVPARCKTWGVPKGAKNVEGAAYFLRYFLDSSNVTSDDLFYNSQFETVFKEITKNDARVQNQMGFGLLDYVTTGTYREFSQALGTATSGNISTVVAKYKAKANSAIKKANQQLSRLK